MLSSKLLRATSQCSIIGFNSHSFNDAVNNMALLQTPVRWREGVLGCDCTVRVTCSGLHMSDTISANCYLNTLHTLCPKSVGSFLESSHGSYLFIFS